MAEFVYHCHHCRKQHRHNKGFIFVFQQDADATGKGGHLYFCNIDCCNAWEMEQCVEIEEEEIVELPKPDRRGAVNATRKLHSGDRLAFFQKHIDCNPERWRRCYNDDCWGAKRYYIRKARGLPQRKVTDGEANHRRAQSRTANR